MFDLIRIFLLFYYVIYRFSSDVDIEIKEPEAHTGEVEGIILLLAALNLVSWIRSLSYLRLFQRTRALIRLIVEVCVDMIPFFIVLLVAMTGFTITFYTLQPAPYEFSEALKNNYRLMFGDFDPGNYTPANWILFIISSAFLPLVMLNMLIAIMSDTYARVMGEVVPSDFLELAKMIFEQEQMLFWKRSQGTNQHLHFANILE